MRMLTDLLCSQITSSIIKCVLKCWIMLLIVGCPSHNNGLSPFVGDKNSKMIRKNQYLLLPHVPNRNGDKVDASNSSSNNNETSDTNDMNLQHIVNHNFLMETSENNNLASVNENDENYFEIFKTPMRFGTENHTEVIAQVGTTAHLPCTIHNIGEGVVSWIRKNDYHLLTVGLTTYSSDERFCATHLKNSEDWTLQIKYVQMRDAGQYECQVTKYPPMSIFLTLNVVEARAEIVGPSLKYLTPGSTLKLICKVLQSTEATAYIFWYHDNRMINYDLDRGINVSSEADFHYSELTILHTTKDHSGNYTCVPSNSQPASVVVHIFKGDVAAMYHEHRSCGSCCWLKHHVMNIILLLAISKLVSFVNFKFVAV
ncbi:unnamed protein product [Chironomus riparius]|uniref:Ig-like domain-containing protein n=1 Tax=Chironomus riparius TaxID=315576 RepID=A0A9N9RQJ5_9DIPT|nr:unnamed protein product [Chironomus riparius]